MFAIVVLAISDNLFLFWPTQSRPFVTRILPTTLLPSLRGILRTITSALLLASRLRDCAPPLHVSRFLHPVPRAGSVKHISLHLEQA